MDNPMPIAQKERVLTFSPDGPQGARLGVAVTPDKQQAYTQLATESMNQGLNVQAFLKLLQQQGFNVFDASSL